MNLYQDKMALTYDDITLVPQYSEIESRSEISLTTNLNHFGDFEMPIIGSPMDTVCEVDMCRVLAKNGGFGVLHRYATIADRANWARQLTDENMVVAAAIGTTGDYFDEARILYDVGVRIFCVDVAHGHHVFMKKALENLRTFFGNTIHIMAGNVATAEGFEALVSWGADSIRVGVGGGSVCSTRVNTGNGIPNVTSLQLAKKIKDQLGSNVSIIADGGLRTSGDIVKAYAVGADFVMVGSLLAGTEETPGKIIEDASGTKRKEYRGMASRDAQSDWRGKVSVVEGVSSFLDYRGPVQPILNTLIGGIKSGISYAGISNKNDFCDNALYMVQTHASTIEGTPHFTRGR